MIAITVLETIKKETELFFKKMSFDVSVDVKISDNEAILVNIETEDPKILIGEGGQTLENIHFLLKAVLRKKVKETFYLDLDINNYREKKAQYLKETAKNMADEVAATGREKTLPPMTAYERRVVHLELMNRSDVKTESRGEGDSRRLIIKPV